MYGTARQSSGKIRLGELLVTFGIISQEQLEDALFEQKKSGRRLGQVLRQLGYVSEETMIEFLGKQLNIPSIDLEQVVPDKQVVNLIPEAIARRHRAIPVSKAGNVLTLAMSDPLDVFAIDDVAGITGCEISAVVSTERSVLKAIDKYYWIQETAPDADADVTYSTDHSEQLIDNANMADGSAVKLVNMIIRQAVNDRASDIHIEPDERQLRIRNRVDGILHEVMTALMSMHAEVVSRLKIMADLDIAEKRAPQDGRFSVDTGNEKIDIRISTIPTIFGEKIVLRLLEKKAIMVGEEKLGFDERDLPRFRRMINSPYGMILVAGPTGSGKTTTLYTALNIISDVEKNVVTIEDPVEYKLPLTNQIQVNPKAGVTFASGLRSILRQDPDVIMVGEIRDKETADIAVHAALSGHLVFSTIHTNDAPSTAARFIEMGIEPFLASTAILGIIAQRLVRLLCEHCKEAYAPASELLDELGLTHSPNLLFYKPHGCIECKGTGYKGREAIFEILEVDEEIKNLIVAKAPAARIRDAALQKGFRTLREAGLAKIVQGKTSVEAVLRVTQEAEAVADD